MKHLFPRITFNEQFRKNYFVRKFLRFCPRSGKFLGFKTPSEGLLKIFVPLVGLAALLWIAFRVITKPSRITYPCVRASIPLASSFIGYLMFIGLGMAAWLKARKVPRIARTSAVGFVSVFAAAGIFGTYSLENDSEDQIQLATIVQPANQPIGTAVGLFPGRVVWVHNPDATNENAPDTAWFRSKYMNQAVVDNMVSDAVQRLTGTTTDSAAWRAIFQFHNTTRGKGAVNYVSGEKIFIKINQVSGWGGNFNTTDLSVVANSSKGISETSVASVLAVLRQLVNVAGVDQQDIYIGDPIRHIYRHLYDAWYAEFPDIHYLDVSGYANLGREKVVKSTTAKIYYSDHGSVLRANVWDLNRPGTDPIYNDTLYTIFDDAEYIINMPMLKGHKRAGVTMFAKNHFGSHARGDASHLHNGLVAPREDTTLSYRKGYGLYRVQVDLMSHPLLGKKNLVYILDALWATVYEISKPVKWKMAPFNNDWMSSIFASFDPVGIESVGYDFLRTEFTATRGVGTYPQMDGVDDYLHQAADSANWPDSVVYDSNNDNIPDFASLGTHEHWNDSLAMQYSRNLGTGNGIELVKIGGLIDAVQPSSAVRDFVLRQNYPNPFNPATTIEFTLPYRTYVSLKVFNVRGQLVAVLREEQLPAGSYKQVWNASRLASGTYFCVLQTNELKQTRKFLLLK